MERRTISWVCVAAFAFWLFTFSFANGTGANGTVKNKQQNETVASAAVDTERVLQSVADTQQAQNVAAVQQAQAMKPEDATNQVQANDAESTTNQMQASKQEDETTQMQAIAPEDATSQSLGTPQQAVGIALPEMPTLPLACEAAVLMDQKTGTTGDAGICISASATRDGLSLVAVVLGSHSSVERFESAIAMLDYGFATFEAAAVPQCANAPKMQAVKGGAVAQVALDYSAVPQTLLLPKGSGGALESKVVLDEQVTAPILQGAKVGEMQLYSEGVLLAQYPIVTAEGAEKLTVQGAMQQLWMSVCVD